MSSVNDLDYTVDMVNRAQERKRQEFLIKTQDEQLQANFQEVRKQKLQREKKKRKQTIRRVFATALLLGTVAGYLAHPYVDGFCTIQSNDQRISEAYSLDYNNAMYVEKMETYQRGVEIQYLPMEDKGFFYDGPDERIPDISDPGTLTYVKNCVDILDETCRDLTNGEKGYIEMLVENAEIKREVFHMDVDSIGEIMGVDLEDIYTPEEIEALVKAGVSLGGK